MTIRAVFFDVGGTIETYGFTRQLRLHATPAIQQRLLSVGIDLHIGNEQLYDLVSVGLERYHQWSLQTMDEYTPQRVWRDYILKDYSVDLHALGGIAEDLMLYIETHYYQRSMRPEMPVVLETIQKMGFKIGLISNVNSKGQVSTNLDQYHIRHYFYPIVLSSEYGRRKPDPAIFHYAARLANVPTSECVYIGDRIARDIVGATRAGFGLAVQITHNFDHGEPDEGALPDAIITNMTELLDIICIENNQTKHLAISQEEEQLPLRALLFDAGDILYHRPRRGQKLAKFLDCLDLSGKEINPVEKENLEQQAYCGLISQDQFREAILRLHGLSRSDQIEIGKQILDEEDNDLEFFEGVRDTLYQLKNKGYLLGIITDTASPLHVKLKWFERGGFGDVWDCIISSLEIGVRKPDPQIYHAALRQLGIHASQAVFVGHKSSELDGARAVGMQTIAFNYKENAIADFYVEKFADLMSTPLIDRTKSVREA